MTLVGPRLGQLPVEQRMASFARAQVREGVELPPPPATPTNAEMAKRPAGITAFVRALAEHRVDHARLRAFARPVYYSYGSLSNERWEAMAARLPGVFADCTVERYEGLHHMNTSHIAEPQRVAGALRDLWRRAEG